MKVVTVLFLSLLLLKTNAQQLLRKVLDAKSKLPVAFATIKVLHSRGGMMASSNGEFLLDIHNSDSVLFSCIGYESKILSGADIKNEIFLAPKIKELKEVIVSKYQKIKDIKLGNINEIVKGDVNWGPSSGSKDEFAQEILLPDDSLFYRIKEISIPVKKFICFGEILLHVYLEDTLTHLPGEEILMSLITKNNSIFKKEKILVNLEKENLILDGHQSFYIGISWPENFYDSKCVTTLQMSSFSKEITISRSLNFVEYKWFPFGKDFNMYGHHQNIATFISVKIEQLK